MNCEPKLQKCKVVIIACVIYCNYILLLSLLKLLFIDPFDNDVPKI